MNDTTVLHMASQALLLIAELAGPVLVVSLVVGLVVSLFQAVTSIQEFTLTFLPKVVAIGIVLMICGHWMLNDAVTYTEQLYKSIPNMVERARMTVPFSSAFAVAFVLALVRASAWVVICPPFANKSIPAMAKIGISLGIAVDAAVTLQHDPLPSSNAQILTQVLVQAAIGFVLGFVISLFVTAVVAAGSLIDLFSGLNLPQALDPLSLQQTPIIGQFYNLVATALLFTTGSVLVIVDGFLRSFKAVGTTLPHLTMGSVANVITGDVTTFFAAAVEIAAPVIVVLFATQILLALLAKSAPQINVFVFGFPLQILIALLAVGLALVALPGDVTNLVGRATTQIFGA